MLTRKDDRDSAMRQVRDELERASLARAEALVAEQQWRKTRTAADRRTAALAWNRVRHLARLSSDAADALGDL